MKLSAMTTPERSRRGAHGMTLIEVMIAVGIGAIVLLLVCTVFSSSSRAFANIGNYVNMNRASREAVEQMTRDIRKSGNLVSFATNRIELDLAGAALVFSYDPVKRQLIRSRTGEADKCLLSNCDSLEFSMYKNVPLTAGAFEKTTDPLLGKCISISWKCTRTVLGRNCDSESMEEALIVIRNKPLP